MSPRSVTDPLVRDAPLLRADERVDAAVREVLASGLPALPVVDERERLCGIFGEDHVDVDQDFSDAQVAEVFLHHRVLVLPVAEDRRVIGVITRSDFFRALAERFLATK